MKTLTALLLLGLLCSLHTTSAGVIALDTATECCMKFSARIPLQRVVSLRTTSSSCPRKALMFMDVIGHVPLLRRYLTQPMVACHFIDCAVGHQTAIT
ncbi:C-C motif chemokine 13-like isoform X2 [Salvelinus fontinalis]|uniref:C-C motif chemokine 13-like isoform X2 n=1 Tax=Salvelinus fontinalis TaxID=8038 RepID=UPI0024865E93|nr:C-C motif chemokine 13-like isoform X2 [Salvelinus fontinalis]